GRRARLRIWCRKTCGFKSLLSHSMGIVFARRFCTRSRMALNAGAASCGRWRSSPSRPQTAALIDVAEPYKRDGSLLIDTIAVGICDTDRELIAGDYGEAPPGEERLIISHESLGRVILAANGRVLDHVPRRHFLRRPDGADRRPPAEQVA